MTVSDASPGRLEKAFAMFIRLNLKSGKPVYLQIVDQVKAAAGSGALKPGDPLPAIRQLAEELRVNRNTIAKAYSELEHQGVVEAQPGKGCFLVDSPSPLKKEIRRKMLAEEIDHVIVQSRHFQFSRDELIRLVNQRLDDIETTQLKNQS